MSHAEAGLAERAKADSKAKQVGATAPVLLPQVCLTQTLRLAQRLEYRHLMQDGWNGTSVPFIDKAWGIGFSDGIGNFVWDGTYGHGYTLDFHNRTCFDPSGFCDGPGYALHLEGVVSVPEASTQGMMLAGLSLLVYVGRRRATTKVARPECLSFN